MCATQPINEFVCFCCFWFLFADIWQWILLIYAQCDDDAAHGDNDDN